MAQQQGQQGAVCQKCRMLLDAEFEIVDGRPACEACAPGLKQELRQRQEENLKLPGGWWTRAAVFGGGAAMSGAVVYAVIALATGFEASFLALGIGAAVGFAARSGAGNKGGTALQGMAVGLVYAAMALGYFLIAMLGAGSNSALGTAISEFGGGPAVFAIVRPFTSGPVGLISLVLGFFAAWRFCAEGKGASTALGMLQKLADKVED